MCGYTENRIVVFRDFDHVFDLTNRIDLWPRLFSEYQEAVVLEKNDNNLKFQLTTFSEGDRPSRTWVSERNIDKENKVATATRLDPKFPFEYMNIRWEYEDLPGKDGVIMTWIQEFNVHKDCKFSNVQMESFLNRATHRQLKVVKENVEKWEGDF